MIVEALLLQLKNLNSFGIGIAKTKWKYLV
jgi:hypothetical protein